MLALLQCFHSSASRLTRDHAVNPVVAGFVDSRCLSSDSHTCCGVVSARSAKAARCGSPRVAGEVLGQTVVSTGAYILQVGTKAPAARYLWSLYFWPSVSIRPNS